MLLIVDLRSKGTKPPIEALKQVDSVLTSSGFRKEVQSVLQPGRAFSVTYDGPSMEKSKIEELLRQVVDGNDFSLAIEVEESVKFP